VYLITYTVIIQSTYSSPHISFILPASNPWDTDTLV